LLAASISMRSSARPSLMEVQMEHEAFVDRLLSHLGSGSAGAYRFEGWNHAGRPTKEGVAMMSIAGVEPAKIIDAVIGLRAELEDEVQGLDVTDHKEVGYNL